MKTKDLIQGNIYNYQLKFPTDLHAVYIGTEDIYTYFDFETKYVFKVYHNKNGVDCYGNKTRKIYLSESSVNNYVTKK
jgi:hypothetical protein